MYTTKTMRISVASLYNASHGKSEKIRLVISDHLWQDFKLCEDLAADLELIKTKEMIIVLCKDLKIQTILTCPLCLKEKIHSITVPSIEARFYFEKTEDYDEVEHFLLNKRDLTIDIEDFLRQEIILHFPLNPICSKSCKGLCVGCGINLNETNKHKASCHRNQFIDNMASSNKPFSDLKKLLNTKSHG